MYLAFPALPFISSASNAYSVDRINLSLLSSTRLRWTVTPSTYIHVS